MTYIKIITPDGMIVVLENAVQTLSLAANHKPRRTINGTIAQEIFAPTKYKSVISGTGRMPNLPTGQPLTVYCQQPIWQQGKGKSLTLPRPAVPKSILAMDTKNTPIDIKVKENGEISSTQDIDMLRFRPILEMQFLHMDHNQDSWTEETTWSLSLVEI